MRIDLHTHSSVSDGTDPPARLVEAAAVAGLDVMALADHDTTDGWAEAMAAGAHLGVEVVPAVEVSTTWRSADVHLLAYWPDPEHAGLRRMLAGIREGRRTRVPRMLERLAEHGVVLSEDDVRRAASDAVSVGRPHIADALVAAGVVGSRDEAFATWIGEGMPGHVSKPAPSLVDALATVVAAGGVCVLAHPWGRGSRHVLDGPTFQELSGAGLSGLEVDHVDHDEDDRAALRRAAAEADLVVTGGSDYHGLGKAGVPLGMFTTDERAYHALQERRGSAPVVEPGR